MKRRSLLCVVCLLMAVVFSPAVARAVYVEDFADITTLAGIGWVMQNNSAPTGIIGWFQGTDTVFTAQAGAINSYIGANFNNTTGANTISNWLLTPEFKFGTGAEISFWTRTVPTPQYPDRLEVRLSTAGASSNVGTTPTSVGDFTTVLLTVNPTLTTSGYPSVWSQYTINTGNGLPLSGSGRVAFRYYVTSGGPTGANSDYIGIDSVSITEGLPAPTTLLESSLNPSTFGASVTFTATLSAVSGTPTGSVAFKDGGTNIPGCESVALSAGVALCTTSALPGGVRSITAAYSGDASFSASLSPALSQSVSFSIAYSVLSGTGLLSCPDTTPDLGQSVQCTVAPSEAWYLLSLTDFTDHLMDVTSLVSGNTYDLQNISSNHVLEATFGSYTVKRRLGPDKSYHLAVQAAYNASVGADELIAWEMEFTEDLHFDLDGRNVLFTGGYLSDFTTQSGHTSIKGSAAISSGSVTFDKISIQ